MLHFNWHSTTNATILAVIASFTALILVLYATEPNWVKLIDEHGNWILSWKLIVCYSLVFSCLIGAGMLLWKTKDRTIICPKSVISDENFKGYY